MKVKATRLLQCVIVCMALFALGYAPPPAYAGMKAGTNLGAVSYYSSEWVFNDVMKMAKPWMARRVGSDWGSDTGKASRMPVDANGWPKAVPFSVDGSRYYPYTTMPCFSSGSWTLKVDGKGTLKVAGPGMRERTFNLTTSGTKTFTLHFSGVSYKADPSGTDAFPYINLKITDSKSWDPIRNVRMISPGQAGNTSPFHPQFVSKMSSFSAVRFMDWGRTNGSGARDWSSRPKQHWYTQGGNGGVAYEWMVEVTNRLNKDLWVCVPHKATDDYVRNLARLLRDRVEHGRRIYVEYSNEVWNPAFSQHGWVNQNISERNVYRKYGKRSKQVFDLFYAEFRGNTSKGQPSQRLVRVLAGQAAWTYPIEEAYAVAGSSTDAIAIAPYFGRAIKSWEGVPSVTSLLKDERYAQKDRVRGWVSAHKSLANRWGERLVCYEGGQHYRGSGDSLNNSTLTKRLVEANRSGLMRDTYRWWYLPMLSNGGVDLFCQYTSTSKPTKWGMWGAAEHTGQRVGTGTGTATSPGDATKHWAIEDFVRSNR